MKKKYEKPVIKKVKLVPSEAVLAACKSESTAGPDMGFCYMVDVNAFSCSEVGS